MFVSGPTLYSYVWNNPTNFTDPTGFLTAQETTQALKDGTAQATLGDGKTVVGLKATFNEDGSIKTLTVTLPGESTTKTLSFRGVAAGSTLTLMETRGAGLTTAREATLAAVANAGKPTFNELMDKGLGKVGDAWNFLDGEIIQKSPVGPEVEAAVGTLALVKEVVVAEKAVQDVRVVEDAAQLAKPAETAAKGGTYILKDGEEVVKKTGRTNDLARREAELGRKHPDQAFEVDKRTDSYPAQRGREQIIHDANPSAHAQNGGLDRINGISPKNPRRDEYLQAGRELQ